jgi:hypothetical protein
MRIVTFLFQHGARLIPTQLYLAQRFWLFRFKVQDFIVGMIAPAFSTVLTVEAVPAMCA